jgi:Na+-transporting methylmalonyl-CoA/oxaloacetate decarboxylase gamma subunit
MELIEGIIDMLEGLAVIMAVITIIIMVLYGWNDVKKEIMEGIKRYGSRKKI